MAKFEYTVKFNGKKYLPGENVPLESEITEAVAVTEEVAVAESAVEEEPKKETAPKETKSKSNKGGRKPKA